MKVKIKHIFGQKPISNKIYLISAQDKVIYVGMANKQSIQERLSLHINDCFKSKKPSKISKLLFDSCPDYFDWEVEDWDIPDIEKLTGLECDCLKCAEQALYDYFCKKIGIPPLGNKIRPRRCVPLYKIYDGVTTFNKVKDKEFSYIPGKFEKSSTKILRGGGDQVHTNLNTCKGCGKKLNIGSYVYYVYWGLKRQSIFCSKECMHKAIEESK